MRSNSDWTWIGWSSSDEAYKAVTGSVIVKAVKIARQFFHCFGNVGKFIGRLIPIVLIFKLFD